MPARPRSARKPGNLRIIAGEFRGRRIPVPERPGLRPSGDRVRETLFNWLAPWLPGSRCLEPFAGTGALSLEAASRGAARVLAVERDRELADALRERAAHWGAGAVEVINGDAMRVPAGPAERFDIVFLDPPFGAGHVPSTCRLLSRGWLAPGALVYVETDAGEGPGVPADWPVHRERRAGQVAFRLYRVPGGQAECD